MDETWQHNVNLHNSDLQAQISHALILYEKHKEENSKKFIYVFKLQISLF